MSTNPSRADVLGRTMTGVSGPADPMDELGVAAVAAHEMFLALTGAGFGEAQALVIVANVIVAQMRGEEPAAPPPARGWPFSWRPW